jgi:HEPN domain-containing protein
MEASYLIYSERKEELSKLHNHLWEKEWQGEEEKPLAKATSLSSPITQYIIEIVQPAFIFHLGTVYPTTNHKLPTTNYLLIILPPKPSRPLHEYESMIHNKHAGELVAIIKGIKEVNRLRQGGNRFFVNNCIEETLLYSNSKSKLEEPFHIPEGGNLSFFDIGFSKAQSFLKGAHLFIEQENYSLAAFMLHQATEQALSAILHFITGYREQTHNLNKLIQYCKLWVPSVADVFGLRNEEEQNDFYLLQKAYHDSRYRPEFVVTKEQALFLFQKITLLHAAVLTIIDREKATFQYRSSIDEA